MSDNNNNMNTYVNLHAFELCDVYFFAVFFISRETFQNACFHMLHLYTHEWWSEKKYGKLKNWARVRMMEEFIWYNNNNSWYLFVELRILMRYFIENIQPLSLLFVPSPSLLLCRMSVFWWRIFPSQFLCFRQPWLLKMMPSTWIDENKCKSWENCVHKRNRNYLSANNFAPAKASHKNICLHWATYLWAFLFTPLQLQMNCTKRRVENEKNTQLLDIQITFSYIWSSQVALKIPQVGEEFKKRGQYLTPSFVMYSTLQIHPLGWVELCFFAATYRLCSATWTVFPSMHSMALASLSICR